MKWRREGAGAPIPAARSAPNHGAPAVVATAENSEERSAVDAAAAAAAAVGGGADYCH
jgi:hypothetical protein